MSLKRLQALKAVLETGSVTDGAQMLNRTQPQISRLLAALEDEVGFPLFVRQGRGLLPTRECLRFYEGTRHILDGLQDISRVAKSIRSHHEAWLHIVTQPYFAHGIMPNAIHAFSKQYPSARVSLEVRSRVDVGLWMSGQKFDFGMAALPLDFPGLRTQPFAEARVVVAMPPSHPLADRKVLRPEDLRGQPFIALRTSTLLRQFTDELCARQGIELQIVAETSTGESACMMASLGMGLTLSDPVLASRVPGLVLLDFEPALHLRYGFLLPGLFAPSALAQAFAQTVVETVAQIGGSRIKVCDHGGEIRPD
ncbi:LysR family transcriptional regulator [Corticimicrobacter populi]|uniref:LysR family transcriptional regulator n=1 Tax=Corticimicrobacter populi TaxID=2175229 RepID=A0A2V1JU87_9BURK|nr:LysR family transcriptional regulator [Corticimicrobacter populi]PWF21549.1 LysR family transcriptional regulator [Corticimicrobacter populi]